MTVPAASEPPFRRIGIVGLGLIGGSIALAARRAWPSATLIGVDHGEVAARAGRDRVVDDIAPDVRDCGACDLIILAVPLPAMLDMIALLAPLRIESVITDVASTKRQVMAAAARAGLVRFVGGHPMAGSERAGLNHARADLFTGRPWLLIDSQAETPVQNDPRGEHLPVGGGHTDCRRVEEFVRGFGAVPRYTNAEAHDETMAYVSHLPQLVAVSLMNAAADAVGTEGLSTAGPAFGDMTRLASSAPELWQGILAPNADFVAEALARFVANLPTRDELSRGDWVKQAFTRAGAKRGRTQPPNA